jgi:hypothetical protein
MILSELVQRVHQVMVHPTYIRSNQNALQKSIREKASGDKIQNMVFSKKGKYWEFCLSSLVAVLVLTP